MTKSTLAHRAYAPKTDAAAVASMMSQAFGGGEEEIPGWLARSGNEHARVVVEKNVPVACYLRIPMGQFFGGRSVRMVGIAGVAVSLEARGRGVGRFMMEEMVRELASEKTALSVLYPSTQTLYRAVGYERAGKMVDVTVPTDAFVSNRSSTLITRALTDADEAAVDALYRNVAQGRAGYLDRGPYIWSRVRKPRRPDNKPARGYGFFDADGRLFAYAYFVVDFEDKSGFYTVRFTDLQAAGDEGHTALTSWIASLRSMGRTVALRAAPSAAILMRLAEPRYVETSKEDWMARVVDVKAALVGRGYTRDLVTSFTLDVTDALVPANHGTFRVDVARGRAKVARAPLAKRADLALDVRALASLYTGYLSLSDLNTLGLVRGSGAAIARLEGVFAGGAPAMCEMF